MPLPWWTVLKNWRPCTAKSADCKTQQATLSRSFPGPNFSHWVKRTYSTSRDWFFQLSVRIVDYCKQTHAILPRHGRKGTHLVCMIQLSFRIYKQYKPRLAESEVPWRTDNTLRWKQLTPWPEAKWMYISRGPDLYAPHARSIHPDIDELPIEYVVSNWLVHRPVLLRS